MNEIKIWTRKAFTFLLTSTSSFGALCTLSACASSLSYENKKYMNPNNQNLEKKNTVADRIAKNEKEILDFEKEVYDESNEEFDSMRHLDKSDIAIDNISNEEFSPVDVNNLHSIIDKTLTNNYCQKQEECKNDTNEQIQNIRNFTEEKKKTIDNNYKDYLDKLEEQISQKRQNLKQEFDKRMKELEDDVFIKKEQLIRDQRNEEQLLKDNFNQEKRNLKYKKNKEKKEIDLACNESIKKLGIKSKKKKDEK